LSGFRIRLSTIILLLIIKITGARQRFILVLQFGMLSFCRHKIVVVLVGRHFLLNLLFALAYVTWLITTHHHHHCLRRIVTLLIGSIVWNSLWNIGCWIVCIRGIQLFGLSLNTIHCQVFSIVVSLLH
jgi:hypothetical protein